MSSLFTLMRVQASAPLRALVRSHAPAAQASPFHTLSQRFGAAEAEGTPATVKQIDLFPSVRKTEVQLSISNKSGGLADALDILRKNEVNLTRIQSRTAKKDSWAISIFMDWEGSATDPKIKKSVEELQESCLFVNVLASIEIPWFPRSMADLDHFKHRVLSGGAELEADHPGFTDKEYKARREMIAENAFNFTHGDKIPRIEYKSYELETWATCWDGLMKNREFGCIQYQKMIPLLIESCGYSRDNIPQAQDISDFLQEQTGFTIRPVAGLLSSRDFLNGLAFRVFQSTQYIRHHSKPLYTPEPDCVHELMGHVPLFADKDFADFSHEIGLASLGASDDDIQKLATLYWFTVEFGICKQGDQRRAYGAGLLSSFGELKYAMSDEPDVRPFDPFKACVQPFPITTYQPVYFEADSFNDVKLKLRQFCESLHRPFNVEYNPYSGRVDIVQTQM